MRILWGSVGIVAGLWGQTPCFYICFYTNDNDQTKKEIKGNLLQLEIWYEINLLMMYKLQF